MSRRLLVNDALNQLGEVTMWNRLQEWFGCEFVGGDYATLADRAEAISKGATLILRNASYFRPIKAKCPQIGLLQDIFHDGPQKNMQEAVCNKSAATVFNSRYTAAQYGAASEAPLIIPLPVDFSLFTPQNAMGCQQALGLPDGCVCWIGASEGAAGQVKGFDIFMQIVRTNPDIPFVGVFKDSIPQSIPPNLRCYMRLPQADLVRVIGACRVGLCTSRTESQHLAGIEMGACGLPMVAPQVGVYWRNRNLPGIAGWGLSEIVASTAKEYSDAIRVMLVKGSDPAAIRETWQREFDIPVVRAQWEKLVKEVENDSNN